MPSTCADRVHAPRVLVQGTIISGHAVIYAFIRTPYHVDVMEQRALFRRWRPSQPPRCIRSIKRHAKRFTRGIFTLYPFFSSWDFPPPPPSRMCTLFVCLPTRYIVQGHGQVLSMKMYCDPGLIVFAVSHRTVRPSVRARTGCRIYILVGV